jgi:DeoR family transcriptional regulator, fructose operon transcriptional repressor
MNRKTRTDKYFNTYFLYGGCGMIALERLSKIEEYVNKKSFVMISDLADEFKVSESTIRRDIGILEKECKLLRSHGGVLMPEQSNLSVLMGARGKNQSQKRLIGEEAAKLIEDGDSIFFDSSTTVLEVVKSIKMDIRITAVTNDLVIALELEKKPLVNTIVIGGTLRNGTHSLLGTITESNIGGMFFGKTFLGAAGVSLEGHVMNYNLQAMEFRRRIIAVSDKVILTVDGSKFGRKGFATLVNFDKIHSIVTDEIPESFINVLNSFGVSITICD